MDDEERKKIVAEWLIAERTKRGWSYRKTAMIAKTNHVSIAEAEKGRTLLGVEILTKLSRAFNMPEEIILRRIGLMKPISEDEEKLAKMLADAERLPPDLLRVAEGLIERLREQADADSIKKNAVVQAVRVVPE